MCSGGVATLTGGRSTGSATGRPDASEHNNLAIPGNALKPLSGAAPASPLAGSSTGKAFKAPCPLQQIPRSISSLPAAIERAAPAKRYGYRGLVRAIGYAGDAPPVTLLEPRFLADQHEKPVPIFVLSGAPTAGFR